MEIGYDGIRTSVENLLAHFPSDTSIYIVSVIEIRAHMEMKIFTQKTLTCVSERSSEMKWSIFRTLKH